MRRCPGRSEEGRPATGGSVWTEERIRAYGLRMPFQDAMEAVYGVRETKAREMLRRGELGDLRVLTAGRRRWVPTVDVLRALGIEVPTCGPS